MKPLLLLSLAACCLAPVSNAQESFSGSAALDAQMQQAVRDGLIPGGVLLIGHEGKIVHRRAYGNRALVPAKEAMTVDTIFDLASLTKVVATTPAVMKLVEQGKLRIIDPVTTYLPEFQGGKSDLTIRDLLTHFSSGSAPISLSRLLGPAMKPAFAWLWPTSRPILRVSALSIAILILSFSAKSCAD